MLKHKTMLYPHIEFFSSRLLIFHIYIFLSLSADRSEGLTSSTRNLRTKRECTLLLQL